ncbi:uncharacterized protein LOC111696603 isoform X2 [Eurytemora carolleeae]|uniref:uncharacterized protein LOC111696603 isoform X2 n=1 Tax=Eurytemora carolleeae TaxID=1294199 RepID=UPI000C76AEF3|nr:uncharacterized protein LOC111696603 isoform X2 [Eurytemora carolleeae]XP_023322032.1 uncharacterized protein LOC111696603 isoform X2 [Eurytemora carolleeae]XP_023322041.1 uncharacterized protein LOC111696603 isoform X2 [Eurytemora carolleeae]XP_023322049.1 uncharacterized protein LOC111696603 isoform X2 [Eurytemora carolleeae]XP_023322059.1 uncharacterized protein LOC111696603 isoform X2 [Eurytemora carolleeae]XP_023322068.1 uncharacterized protein LOC111696603 isoform X2 [Eurytemora carol|eukprot:XP_023322023.1 uncharacterized protein LOC111696603 isoform X2 [Eurytemora affinis]
MDKLNKRRSCVIIDSIKYDSSSNIVNYTNQTNVSYSDETERNLRRNIDALSLESNVVWENGNLASSLSLTRFRYPEQSSEELVHELLEELVDEVVEKSEAGRREEIVQDYLSRLIPAPLIQTSEVSQISSSLSSASYALTGSASRLKAAWKIILVSTAQQLLSSYRRVLSRKYRELCEDLEMIGEEPRNLLTDPHGLIIQLLRERERIQDRRDGNRPEDNLAPYTEYPLLPYSGQVLDGDGLVLKVSRETMTELREVTDRILELSVLYLKNATRDVVDTSVQDIKDVLSSATEISRL